MKKRLCSGSIKPQRTTAARKGTLSLQRFHCETCKVWQICSSKRMKRKGKTITVVLNAFEARSPSPKAERPSRFGQRHPHTGCIARNPVSPLSLPWCSVAWTTGSSSEKRRRRVVRPSHMGYNNKNGEAFQMNRIGQAKRPAHVAGGSGIWRPKSAPSSRKPGNWQG